MKIPILNFLYDSQGHSVRYKKFNIKNYNTLSFETVKNVNFPIEIKYLETWANTHRSTFFCFLGHSNSNNNSCNSSLNITLIKILKNDNWFHKREFSI